jgi:hypothetical protein
MKHVFKYHLLLPAGGGIVNNWNFNLLSIETNEKCSDKPSPA